MTRWWAVAVVSFLGLTGCASGTPRELLDAREAYRVARNGGTGEVAPSELDAAGDALAKAELAYAKDGNEAHVRDMAYIALRKAEFAMGSAEFVAALRLKKSNEKELVTLAAEAAEEKSVALGVATNQLEKERDARARAEARLKDAMTRLAEVGNVTEDGRGMVITMPGSVLFESGRYLLMTDARTKLDRVAEALLEDRNASIVVEGHTDSQGDDDFNRRLSSDRASEVRDFLIGRGIGADRIIACGHGEGRPIADNNSPEGRADNRRVEIVVTKPGTHLACAF